MACFSTHAATSARTPQKTRLMPTSSPIAHAAELGKSIMMRMASSSEATALMVSRPLPGSPRDRHAAAAISAPVATNHAASSSVSPMAPESGSTTSRTPTTKVSSASNMRHAKRPAARCDTAWTPITVPTMISSQPMKIAVVIVATIGTMIASAPVIRLMAPVTTSHMRALRSASLVR
jgi:hypothetical protein